MVYPVHYFSNIITFVRVSFLKIQKWQLEISKTMFFKLENKNKRVHMNDCSIKFSGIKITMQPF